MSAVVTLRAAGERDPDAPMLGGGRQGGAGAALQALGITMGSDEQAASAPQVTSEMVVVDRVKVFFTRAGFEVHAPFPSGFNIAARKSEFEEYFSVEIFVDEEQLLSGVTLKDGGRELPVEVLPSEVRTIVQAVEFPPPPELPGFFT